LVLRRVLKRKKVYSKRGIADNRKKKGPGDYTFAIRAAEQP